MCPSTSYITKDKVTTVGASQALGAIRASPLEALGSNIYITHTQHSNPQAGGKELLGHNMEARKRVANQKDGRVFSFSYTIFMSTVHSRYITAATVNLRFI